MASKTVRYTPEFKRQMVDLVRGGRSAGVAGEGVRADGLVDCAVGQAGAARCRQRRWRIDVGGARGAVAVAA